MEKATNAQAAVSTGSVVTPPPTTPTSSPETTVKTIQKNTYITAPSSDTIVITEPKTEIVISGKAPTGSDAVYVGGYRLKTFFLGSESFTYRARTDLGNLKEGANVFTVRFEKAGKDLAQESMTIYMLSDPAAREAKKAEYTPSVIPPKPPTPANTTLSGASQIE